MKYDDDKFIELAKVRGYVDEDKLELATKSRKDMEEMGVQDEFMIGDVLLQNNHITQDQHDEIVRELAATRIPGYILEKVMGRGMAGTNYLARKEMTGEFVQVKVIEVGGQDETLEKRFAREASVAKQLKHPNIVGALALGKEGDLFYFVSEYFEGKNGKERLKEVGALDEQTGLQVLASIAAALEEVWKLKIVHRDIKPENILFTNDGQVKLAELGTVKNTGADAQQQQLTMPGMVLGSVDYMSPEQAMGGQPLDVRSDIYSLGATVYQLLTGKTPWEGQPPAARSKGQVIPPTQRNSSLSENISRLVMRCMRHEVDLRYQTPTELLADVQRVMQGKGVAKPASKAGSAKPVSRALTSGPEKDRTLMYAILIGVGLGLAGLAVGYFMLM